MIQLLDDGRRICSRHWDEAFGSLKPLMNWIAGECDFCAKAAASALGRKGGSVRSAAKSAAAKANNAARKLNGKPEGGRPRKIK